MISLDKLSEKLYDWSEKTVERCVKAQKDTAKKIWEDVINNAPYPFK